MDANAISPTESVLNERRIIFIGLSLKSGDSGGYDAPRVFYPAPSRVKYFVTLGVLPGN